MGIGNLHGIYYPIIVNPCKHCFDNHSFLLLIGLRKSKKNSQTSADPGQQKERKNELSGLLISKPEEFKAQKFEHKKDVLTIKHSPPVTLPDRE